MHLDGFVIPVPEAKRQGRMIFGWFEPILDLRRTA